MSTHTLSVLVENKPGVLAHVAGLFSRRAFNISSLAVGPTEDERVSRMTIVVDGASTPVEQVAKQLDKLIRVLKVVELDSGASVERELALIKVRIEPARRGELLEVATVFNANIGFDLQALSPRLKGMGANLVVSNLTDKRYLAGVDGRDNAFIGAPRTVGISFRVDL